MVKLEEEFESVTRKTLYNVKDTLKLQEKDRKYFRIIGGVAGFLAVDGGAATFYSAYQIIKGLSNHNYYEAVGGIVTLIPSAIFSFLAGACSDASFNRAKERSEEIMHNRQTINWLEDALSKGDKK